MNSNWKPWKPGQSVMHNMPGNPVKSGPSAMFIFCLFVLTAGLAGIYYIGPFGSDDLQYTQLGAAGAEGARMMLGSGRFAISGFYYYFWTWFGLHGAIFAFFLYAFAAACATYLLFRGGAQEFGARFAGILVATNGIIFYFSAAVMPDNALAFFYILHLGFFAKFVWGGRNQWAALVSGAAAALCYVTKEAAVIFLVPTVVAGGVLLIRERGQVMRGVLFFVSGALAIVIADMVASQMAFGDAVFRLSQAADLDVKGDAAKFMETQGYGPVERFSYALDRISAYMPRWLFLFGLASMVACCIPSAARRFGGDETVRFVAAGGLLTFAYLTWGTISLTSYIGIPLQARYYAPVIPPMCLAIAVVIQGLRAILPKSAALRAALVAVTGLGLLYLIMKPIDIAGRAYRSAEVMALGRAVSVAKAMRPEAKVYGDTYVSGRYAAYGTETGVLPFGQFAATGENIHFLQSESNPRREDELEAIRVCASKITEIPAEEFRIPDSRISDISFMLGDVDGTAFSAAQPIHLYFVEGPASLCKVTP